MNITDNFPTDDQLKAKADKYLAELRGQLAKDRPAIIHLCRQITAELRKRLKGHQFDVTYRVEYAIDHLAADFDEEDSKLIVVAVFASADPGLRDKVERLEDEFGVRFNFPSVHKDWHRKSNGLWCGTFLSGPDDDLEAGQYGLELHYSDTCL